MRRRGKITSGGGRDIARSSGIYDGLLLVSILDSSCRHKGRGCGI